MEIGRKIYYETLTGNVLVDTGERSGSVIETTEEQDFAVYTALQGRTNETIGYILLEYGQLLDKFNSCYGYHVDITKNPIDANAIIFNLTPPESSLEEVKTAKITELENTCTQLKDGGFTSNCLGIEKTFDSSPENRNLIMGLAMKASLIASGVTLSDSNVDWKSKDEPVCYPWQPQQMIVLGVDMSTFMTKIIKQKELLQQYVGTLTTIEEINAVTWDTVIPN